MTSTVKNLSIVSWILNRVKTSSVAPRGTNLTRSSLRHVRKRIWGMWAHNFTTNWPKVHIKAHQKVIWTISSQGDWVMWPRSWDQTNLRGSRTITARWETTALDLMIANPTHHQCWCLAQLWIPVCLSHSSSLLQLTATISSAAKMTSDPPN